MTSAPGGPLPDPAPQPLPRRPRVNPLIWHWLALLAGCIVIYGTGYLIAS
jgi:hypothetical protein